MLTVRKNPDHTIYKENDITNTDYWGRESLKKEKTKNIPTA